MSVSPSPLLAVSYFASFETPGLSSSWGRLLNGLKTKGVSIWNDDCRFNPTHWLAIDYVKSSAKHLVSVPIQNRFLICAEPRVVNPLQYTKHVLEKFSRVAACNSDILTTSSWDRTPGGSFDPMYRPNENFSNNGTRDGCVMLNENKFSLISTSNYALRSRLVRKASSLNIPLTIGGRDWSRGHIWTAGQIFFHALIALRAGEIPSVSQIVLPIRRDSQTHRLGPVFDELSLLSQFKICVVIENESSYVSEKLIKALKAGCQCVYVGPSLNPFNFPKGFLHPAEASIDDISRAVKEALDCSYQIDSRAIEAWCTSSEFTAQESVDIRNSWLLEEVFQWLATTKSKS